LTQPVGSGPVPVIKSVREISSWFDPTRWVQRITESPILTGTADDDWHDGLCNVMVDIAATDEQIMADFRHWLTHFRKAIGIQAPAQNITEKDFRVWIEARVLPYIDLHLWSLVHRRQITQNVMGQAVSR